MLKLDLQRNLEEPEGRMDKLIRPEIGTVRLSVVS